MALLEHDIRVPHQSFPHVVGERQLNLDVIEKATGAVLTAFTIDEKIRIRGTKQQVDASLKELQQLMKTCSVCDVEYLIVPSAISAELMGDNGCRLKDLQARFGAKCQMVADPLNNLIWWASIEGNVAEREMTKSSMLSIMKSLLDERSTLVLSIPVTSVPAVIGRNGMAIKELCRISEGPICSVQKDANEATIHITGSGRQRQFAHFHVERTIHDLLKNTVLNGPEENCMIFSSPFLASCVVSVVPVDPSKNDTSFILDLVSSKDADENVPVDSCVCLSLNMKNNSMIFNSRDKNAIVNRLISRVSEHLLHPHSTTSSFVKLELSLGKQTFSISSLNCAPSQFQLPDACMAPNGSLFDHLFSSSRFVDKFAESAQDHLAEELKNSGMAVEAPDSGHVTCTMEIYWKQLSSHRRLKTVMQMEANGEWKLVQIIEQRFKPIVVTFLHPGSMCDFRARVDVCKELSLEQAPAELQSLLDSLVVEYNPTANFPRVTISYSKLTWFTHGLIRLRSKDDWKLDNSPITASVYHVYSQPTPFSPHPNSKVVRYEPQPTESIVQLTLKDQNIKNIISHSQSGSQSFTDELSLRQNLAASLAPLLDFGQLLSSKITWSGTDFK